MSGTETWPKVATTTTVRNALSLMVGSGSDRVCVVGDDGDVKGLLRLSRIEELLR